MKKVLAPAILASALLSTYPARAQLLTIPEALAHAGKSLRSGPSVPSGPTPSVEAVLQRTDLIVRCVVSASRSYLSDDQMDIFTDYTLLNPTIVFRRNETAGEQQTAPGSVTIFGGAVEVNGLTFTQTHDALPKLDDGGEYVLLLKVFNGKLYPAGRYYGAFKLTPSGAVPAAMKSGFADNLRGLSGDALLEELVSRATARQK